VPRQPTTDSQQQLAALTRARDRYEAAFEEAFDAMVSINDDARIVDANPQAASIYGLDNRELLGRAIPEFLPADFDFETAWEQFQEAGGERDTVTIHGADGVKRPVEYAATTDIVPSQHLIIVREQSEHAE
jgi:PAS domain S-box-containing protein